MHLGINRKIPYNSIPPRARWVGMDAKLKIMVQRDVPKICDLSAHKVRPEPYTIEYVSLIDDNAPKRSLVAACLD